MNAAKDLEGFHRGVRHLRQRVEVLRGHAGDRTQSTAMPSRSIELGERVVVRLQMRERNECSRAPVGARVQLATLVKESVPLIGGFVCDGHGTRADTRTFLNELHALVFFLLQLDLLVRLWRRTSRKCLLYSLSRGGDLT